MKITTQKLCENHIEQTLDDGSLRFVKYLTDENGEEFAVIASPERETYELAGGRSCD